MIHRFALLLILFCSAAALTACSSGNSTAPPDNQAHPTGWVATHPEELPALADYSDCTGCHGADFQGYGDAVSCYSCHAFNDAPPFTIHPASWSDTFIDHRGYARTNTAESCTGCHGSDLLGGVATPSCFSASVDDIRCHSEGPGVAPHLQDEEGSYLAPAEHGTEAKADLMLCQACHGEIVTLATSPRFNLGIYRISGNGCEGCHNDYTAHPAVGDRESVHWYGAPYNHADSGNLEACALCHGSDFEGNAEINAPACIGCHIVDPVANSEGCVSCHNLPPDSAGLAGDQEPNLQGQHGRIGHARAIAENAADTCQRCHNEAGPGSDQHFNGSYPTEVNFLRPDAADTITAESDGENITCTGACHILNDATDFIWEHSSSKWY